METTKPIDIHKARAILEAAPGVQLVDDPSHNLYPMPLTATGQYDVQVGRLRQSLAFGDHGLEFFVSGDQLLRGAALNAVLVAEEMHQY
jgi:aspartate-semialdehyde dehydrogenase